MGLALTLFMVGGISVDLWRALADHRELAGIADAAAVAASSGIDAQTFRSSGDVILDPSLARQRGQAVISSFIAQSDAGGLDSQSIAVIGGGTVVQVDLARTMELGLLQLLAPGRNITISVRAVADASLRL